MVLVILGQILLRGKSVVTSVGLKPVVLDGHGLQILIELNIFVKCVSSNKKSKEWTTLELFLAFVHVGKVFKTAFLAQFELYGRIYAKTIRTSIIRLSIFALFSNNIIYLTYGYEMLLT